MISFTYPGTVQLTPLGLVAAVARKHGADFIGCIPIAGGLVVVMHLPTYDVERCEQARSDLDEVLATDGRLSQLRAALNERLMAYVHSMGVRTASVTTGGW